ncbi:hypothetical protein GSF22_07460 [Micromonospora echinofusca]|uniref:Uncharacterized protein n=2 Tax=Micromonospora echinofusca TaxID=47858 RepID=A0ABS3VN08_MICEH|nr:hypothetical protein [Micromonospora echinofusca]
MVWRQDDNGNRYPVGGYDDRIDALARVLALESGVVHKQTYWVDGPPGPVCATNRDLYVRLVDAGERMTDSGRTLDGFLRAWWLVARPLAGRRELDLDTVAAMVVAAGTVPPPPLLTSWRTAEFAHVDEPADHADWERIVLSQIADLADFADQGPLDEHAYFGVDAPRPAGCVRATDRRWYNFDPRGYLECGMAGALGGWDEADGLRVPVPGPVLPLRPEPAPGERPLPTLTWADLADLAICGQEYE